MMLVFVLLKKSEFGLTYIPSFVCKIVGMSNFFTSFFLHFVLFPVPINTVIKKAMNSVIKILDLKKFFMSMSFLYIMVD